MLSPERVRRTLVRLAYEIVERNKGAGDLLFLGIQNGGVALARALASHVPASTNTLLDRVHGLDVTSFRDDRDRSQGPVSSPVNKELDVDDKHVVIVDDVLFTGRTARAAIDAVISLGRPKTIQLAVLIDRGFREFPIEPTFVGRTVQTKHKERIVVDVEDDFAVYVDE